MATLEVEIWGEKIRLNSDKDEEFIQRVADYLNDKMRVVHSSDSTLLTTKIAALRAAFMIAAEYVALQQEVDSLELAVDEVEKQLGIISIEHL